jgi:hypothetical protein
MGKYKYYALYKGDDLLAMGTVVEIAEEVGVLPDTVHFYNTPSYKKRVKDKNRRDLIILED